MEDVGLWKASQRGDMRAFEELVARHRDKIYARAFSMIRNEEDATDLSQEAWVKAWQRLKQFQGDSSFLTWNCFSLCHAFTQASCERSTASSSFRIMLKARA